MDQIEVVQTGKNWCFQQWLSNLETKKKVPDGSDTFPEPDGVRAGVHLHPHPLPEDSYKRRGERGAGPKQPD